MTRFLFIGLLAATTLLLTNCDDDYRRDGLGLNTTIPAPHLGDLVVTLSWDRNLADLDLVMDGCPTGDAAASALVIPDEDNGTGREYVVWTGSAPDGRYDFHVDYRGGVRAADFTVTIEGGREEAVHYLDACDGATGRRTFSFVKRGENRSFVSP